MGKNAKYLVIYDDGETAYMTFFDSATDVANHCDVPQDKITDIISGKCKNILDSKYSSTTSNLSIMKVSIVNYQYYNDDIIASIEAYNKASK